MLSFRSQENRIRRLQKNLMGRYKAVFSLDRTRHVEIADHQTPILVNGDRAVNMDHAVVDSFAKETGGNASLFVRHGEAFIRVATTVKDAKGARALGVTLERSHPAYQLLLSGSSYFGYSTLSGKKFTVLYSPICDASNVIIGASVAGIDISNTKQPSLALKLSLLVMAWTTALVVGRDVAVYLLLDARTPLLPIPYPPRYQWIEATK